MGGLERVVEALATGQHGAGHVVHVAAVLDAGTGEHPLVRGLRAGGVDVECIRLPPRAYGLERERLRSLLRAVAPDVVHTHGYREDLQAGAVARRLGISTVTTVHGFTGGGWKNRLYEWLQVRAFRRFDAVVAVSRPIAARLEAAGVRRDRIHVVPNAAPPDQPRQPRMAARQALRAADDEILVGWIGRLGMEKGPDLILEALARLDPSVRLAMIGAGRQRQRLERLATRLGVSPRIRWLGHVADAARLFLAFDVFVLSSRTEGAPIVLFEAMAAGTPIVATAVGGVPDIVSPAEAVLVPPGDPPALAAAIRAVLAEPGAARERAERARRRLEAERGLVPWLARYDAVYRQVLTVSPGRIA